MLPAHALYAEQAQPYERADVVIDTRDLSAPRIVRLRADD